MKRLLCLLLIIIFSFDVTAQDYDDTILPDSLALLLQDKSDKIVSLAVIVDYYFDNRMYQKAKPYIDEINRLSKAKKDSYANVLSDFYIGTLMIDNNHYEQAFQCLFSAKNAAFLLSESPKNKRLQIRILNSLGVCYSRSMLLTEAFEHYQHGLELNKELKDKKLELILRSNMATVYGMRKRYEDEIAIDKAIVSDSTFSIMDKFVNYLNIGTVYIYINKFDSALMYLNTAKAHATTTNDYAKVIIYEGIIYNKMYLFNDALCCFTKSNEILRKSGEDNIDILTLVLIDAGYSYSMIKEYDTALILLNKGIDLASKYHFLESELDGILKKTQILYDLARYKESVECFQKYNVLLDSLSRVKDIARLEQSYQQQNIKEIENKYKLEQVIISKKQFRQRIFFLFTLILLVFIILIILLLLNRKNIILKNKKIKEQLLSNELDRRNRELASRLLLQTQKNKLVSDSLRTLNQSTANKELPLENIEPVIHDLKQAMQEDSPQDFDYYFVKTHPNFYARLQSDFPKLTQTELHLCAYLKLNLSTKDIAVISNINPNSARIARARLRKTLGLAKTKTTITEFLVKY
ncbi:MAG: hypothetical protein PHU62_07425 [Bacteroidales bacterium]|nr:hypothetical protein [Bacteroidales bacterium]MDD2205040.1 hypothetical protein [Bacteroidales bacterium]MDD3151510.1 hypothetical protein [Bacteroidales bacterium]MDD3914517.1 hypothetical protein [Bacteroidales bacterium]MDD4634383.1 hypothetical protein [Bacteroidales bacterium]